MIELVLIVCLNAQPDKCETIYMRQDVPVSMMQCLFNGAKQAAAWAENHPGWIVKRWNCGAPRA
jgi:acyl-ACP thioesterase